MQSPPGAGDGRIAVTPRPGQAADAVAELPDLPSPPRSGSRRDGPARSPGPAAPTGRAARPAASRPVRSPAMGSHEKDPSSPRRALSRSNSTVSSKHSSVQQGSESWEVVEEPRGRGSPGRQPHRHEGYLLKKRKWPLKGWHKRYFVLENGILKYSTTRQDVLKGKLHGAIDVRQSVMSVNKKAQRVDLDTEDNIYHLKIKSPEVFSSWVSSLCTHHHGERPEPCPPGGPSAQGQWTRMLPSGSAPALSTLASSRDKVNAWLKDSEGLERCSAELSECQAKLQELTGMLQHLEALHRIPSAPLISGSQPSGATERPKKGRRSTRIWCTQSFAKDDTIGRVRVGRLHGSVPNLSRYLEPSQSQLPFSLPPEYSQLQRSFWVLAQKVHGSLSSVVAALVAERARLEEMRQTLDRQGPAPRPGTTGPGLRRFHSLSVSSDTTLDSFASLHPDEPDSLPAKGREQQLSNRSIVSLADSHTEFFDACEVFLSASSSENERLCEELEYSALLDRASRARDPRQRLVYVAAFAVSAYASTYYRAGCKPFNPVLGETYECVRPDRGFRFISEQVSHHPPVSACHAESENFVFWQDMRWKNKFWGKSLEIVPVGTVNVQLPRTGDHYEWNKVTTCIHNVLSGPRWIEHYGEVLIRNTRDASYHCKLTFCKARYWGAGANEVQGAVLSRGGAAVERLAGKWHEGLHRGPAPGLCVWRANPMPRDHERNYGFTQFALELNELTPELRRVLPSTDTRLRPDQRFLEEGNVPAAEAQKRQIEQLQRDRRRVMEENNITHQARFFRRLTDASGKESWVTNNTYWKLRLDPGFAHLDSAVLW
ncbi:oxysterol-binding protein-related protein 7 isoform X5 [Chamaea fasciata]|uniref:oxysterol-binding protein-related protein 7 isoform X5 n=1 Tax=Chamaea fasciata TaxID=190680 RepID=UPI00336A4E69